MVIVVGVVVVVVMRCSWHACVTGLQQHFAEAVCFVNAPYATHTFRFLIPWHFFSD